MLYADDGGDNDGVYGSGNVYEHNAFGVEHSGFIYWSGLKSTYDAMGGRVRYQHAVGRDRSTVGRERLGCICSRPRRAST